MKLRLSSLFFSLALLTLGSLSASAQTSAKKVKCVPVVPKNGDVLIAGGVNNVFNSTFRANTPIAEGEFFDPSTGKFSSACNMTVAREEVVPLNFGSGILMMGGENANSKGVFSHLVSTDLYSPSTGKFSNGPHPKAAIEDTVAIPLADGRQLVPNGAGSKNGNDFPLKTLMLYVPTQKKFLPLKATMSIARDDIRGAQIGGCGCPMDGMVLLVGGFDGTSALKLVELFDPKTLTVTKTGALNTARDEPTVTALKNGTVLVAGGFDDLNNGNTFNTAELYSPVTGTFVPIASTMSSPRGSHTATLLNDGTVLLAGGENGTNGNFFPVATADIYNSTTNTFTATTQSMVASREQHTATLIAGSGTNLDGQVLITGGYSTASFNVVNSAEVFNPNGQTFTATGNMLSTHAEHGAALIP